MLDSLIQLAPLLSVTIAAISSAVACYSVWLNYRGQERQRRSELITREHQMYQVAVIEPMQKYLTEFVDITTTRLMSGFKDLSEMSANDRPHGVVSARRRELLQSLTDEWHQLEWRMMAGAKAWEDQRLETDLDEALTDLFDEIAAILERWDNTPTATPQLSDVLSLLQNHASKLLTLMRHYAPGLEAIPLSVASLPTSGVLPIPANVRFGRPSRERILK